MFQQNFLDGMFISLSMKNLPADDLVNGAKEQTSISKLLLHFGTTNLEVIKNKTEFVPGTRCPFNRNTYFLVKVSLNFLDYPREWGAGGGGIK